MLREICFLSHLKVIVVQFTIGVAAFCNFRGLQNSQMPFSIGQLISCLFSDLVGVDYTWRDCTPARLISRLFRDHLNEDTLSSKRGAVSFEDDEAWESLLAIRNVVPVYIATMWLLWESESSRCLTVSLLCSDPVASSCTQIASSICRKAWPETGKV